MDIQQSRQQLAFTLLRVMISIIIFSHGGHRLLEAGYNGFGAALDARGIPFGLALAWFITLFEIIGAIFLAVGKKVIYLCIVYIAIYLSGLFLVHLPHGWFVVGSGTNGIEYSLLIITTLFSIAFASYKPNNKLNGIQTANR